MKLLSLNTYAGREFDALMRYLSEQAETIDIFCFQELFHTTTDRVLVEERYRANLFSELEGLLKNHKGYFAPVQDGMGFDNSVDFFLQWGTGMFLKEGLDVRKVDNTFIRENYLKNATPGSIPPRSLQYAVIHEGDQKYSVLHFHGLWTGGGKGDTPQRIEQSQRVRRIYDSLEGSKVLCGDFNLLPDTQSLAILEEGNLNLIKKFGVSSTRSKIYKNYETGSRFADYTIVSPDINVDSFEVPYVEASDHLPMVLEFT